MRSFAKFYMTWFLYVPYLLLFCVFFLFGIYNISIFHRSSLLYKLRIFIEVLIVLIFPVYVLIKKRIEIPYFILIIFLATLPSVFLMGLQGTFSMTTFSYIVLFLTFLVTYNVSKRQFLMLAKISAFYYLVFSFVVIFLVLKGVLPNKVIYSDGRVRFFMGFEYVNHFSLIVFLSFLTFCFVRMCNMSFVVLLYFILILCFTGSRSFFFAIVLSLFVVIGIKFFLFLPKPCKSLLMLFIAFLFIIIGIILPLGSYALRIAYPNLDYLFSSRLYLYETSLKENFYLINFFFGNVDPNVDSTYLDLIGGIGFVSAIILFCYTLIAVYRYSINEKYLELFIIYNILLVGIVEQILSPSFILSYLFLYLISIKNRNLIIKI